jgi:hypothetical protein
MYKSDSARMKFSTVTGTGSVAAFCANAAVAATVNVMAVNAICAFTALSLN